MIVDFHVHIFPDLSRTKVMNRAFGGERVEAFRGLMRKKTAGLSEKMHEIQSKFRNLPVPLRGIVEELSAFVPLPQLFLESSVGDLLESMDANGIDKSVVIAHPSICSNERLFSDLKKNPRLIPVVYVPMGTPRPAIELKKWTERGARALKIHASSDGLDISSPHYRQLLHAARELKLPVILHTGCFHSHLFYKRPEFGDIDSFDAWFSEYSDVNFIAAHMNYHDPERAILSAEKHKNVWLDTSWQPAEVVAEAIRRVGSKRVLMASDWPFLGGTQKEMKRRTEAAFAELNLSELERADVLGLNALNLLGENHADPA